MIAPKSAIDAAAMISWPKRRGDLAGVLEHRHQHAQRRRAQDDRDQQRRVHETARAQQQRHGERDRERQREARGGQPQQRPAELLELDLQPGQEQHEREPDQRDDLDGLIDLGPAEHRRADDDAGDDLEHHRGQLQAREEAEDERRGERDRHDQEQVVERGGHGSAVRPGPDSLRPWTRPAPRG